MKDLETNKYRQILDAKRAELVQGLRDRNPIAIEHSAEEYEQMTLATQRELAIIALERDARLARDVEAALRRLDEGHYGICEHCEEEISPKRLNALPWARYCVHCQEEADRGAIETTPSPEHPFSLAA
jgi:DnaK suppressor protein